MVRTNPIEKRVERSLKCLGCHDIIATDLGDGRIKIVGEAESRDELAIVVAMARTVPGVVTIEETLSIKS